MKKKKTLRKKYQVKRNKSFFEGYLFATIYFFLFLLFFFFYFFTFDSFLKVDSIEVDCAKNLKKEALEDFINESVETNFLFLKTKNIILVSPEKIKHNVLSKTSIIEDIKIEKIFPSRIVASTKERVPFAIWCILPDTRTCAFLDKNGIPFQIIDQVKKGPLVFIKEREPSLGVEIITPENLTLLSLLRKNLLLENIEINYFEIIEEKDILAYTQEGWKIYFSLENNKQEVENLSLIMNEIDQAKRRELKYIDLRFGDRIYYK